MDNIVKKIRYDSNGIPRLSRQELDAWAERFTLFFDKDALSQPQMTPIFTICDRLKEEHEVKFVFGADLGTSPEGYKYRGRFHIPTSTIYIDKSLEWDDPRFNFTLAHELAHFVLHRRINTDTLKTGHDKDISDTNRQLILDHVNSDNPRDWLEWQANKFASSFLLPRLTVPTAIVEKQLEIGVTRRVGTIYLDRQATNIEMYHKILEHLVKIYETSKTSIKLRLIELNILIEAETGQTPQSRPIESVGQVMRDMFNKLSNECMEFGGYNTIKGRPK